MVTVCGFLPGAQILLPALNLDKQKQRERAASRSRGRAHHPFSEFSQTAPDFSFLCQHFIMSSALGPGSLPELPSISAASALDNSHSVTFS